MTIYIKSFNRAYYLERCIRSVISQVSGIYTIVVLDDGTPEKYLDKIVSLFPGITIMRSDQHARKTNAIASHIANHSAYNDNSIPAAFWYREISNGSDIFLLLEEDAWITEPIHLAETEQTMIANGLEIVKIGWNGSDRVVTGKKEKITANVESIEPALPTTSVTLLSPVFKNTFKIRSVLLKLKVLSPFFSLPFYTLYTVTSAFFTKKYWLYLWKDAENSVNEGYQLSRAVQWLNHHHTKYGKTTSEALRTSFITSSTNRFKHDECDMLRINHHLNEAWMYGRLNCQQNLPRDFELDYLKSFIPESEMTKLASDWDTWIRTFKGLYREIGCDVGD